MNELEFWDTYRASQAKVHLSEDKKDTILNKAQKVTREEGMQTSLPQPIFVNWKAEAASGEVTSKAATSREVTSRGAAPTGAMPRGAESKIASASGGKSPSKPRLRKRLPRFTVPVAACFIVLGLAVGVIALSTNLGQKGAGTHGVTADFSLQAYASETDTILEMGNDNQIIFSRREPGHDLTNGYYTGCIFRVQGEGITRMQASVSQGMLYRQTYEHFRAGDEPERIKELSIWKPTVRGMGEYYGKYDDVTRVPGRSDGLPQGSPDHQITVGLSKKLGSVIDVPVDPDSGGVYSGTYFGFWMGSNSEEDLSENSSYEDYVAYADGLINRFEGATLTVTASFEDGHTTTQIIELHAADVRASQEEGSAGEFFTVLYPEIVDASKGDLQRGTDYEHTLYGKIIETNSNPFPDSLENANEYEGIVDTPMSLPSDGWSLTYDGGTINQISMESSGAVGPVYLSDNGYFNVSNFKVAYKGKTLPEGITLSKLWTGMGSWEYQNYVTSQLDGYTLDEQGTPSDGFSWVMLEADLTSLNEGDSYAFGGRLPGNFAVVDKDGKVSGIITRAFGFKTDDPWWDELNSDGSLNINQAHVPFTANESKTLRWLAVVPDFALDDPSLFFCVFLGSSAMAVSPSSVGLEVRLP